jgi:transcriptional regulator with XRE-family HTH domain
VQIISYNQLAVDKMFRFVVDSLSALSYNLLERGDNMDFAKKIFEIRKGLGLSQEEFGAMINVSRQAVSKWELGQSKPDIDTLILLCKTLNISSDELILSNSSQESSENEERNEFNLNEVFLSKRRFILGIVFMILGVFSLFMLWLDIRVGSHFMETFWNGLLYPMELLIFIISIIIIIIGLGISVQSSNKVRERK